MMFCDFETTTHGKWILAGEHAVLRGHGALVFPILEKRLCLSYKNSGSRLSANYSGSSGADMHLLFWSVLEQGQQLLGKSLNDLSGHFDLYCDIPIGVGMGASAALCVATARWFKAQNLLGVESVYSFARNLEDLFHGKSSGLDIAGVAAEAGNFFCQGEVTFLNPSWQPCWYLSSCGQIGITSHCIHQVQELWKTDAAKAAIIDKKMNQSVNKARAALESYSPESLKNLAEAMYDTAECFRQWGLVSETLEHHMQNLHNLGALAVKPTGSGGGGFVVSLWENAPPTNQIEFIPI